MRVQKIKRVISYMLYVSIDILCVYVITCKASWSVEHQIFKTNGQRYSNAVGCGLATVCAMCNKISKRSVRVWAHLLLDAVLRH